MKLAQSVVPDRDQLRVARQLRVLLNATDIPVDHSRLSGDSLTRLVGQLSVLSGHAITQGHEFITRSPYVFVVSGHLDVIDKGGRPQHRLVARLGSGESFGPCGKRKHILESCVIIATEPTVLLYVRQPLPVFIELQNALLAASGKPIPAAEAPSPVAQARSPSPPLIAATSPRGVVVGAPTLQPAPTAATATPVGAAGAAEHFQHFTDLPPEQAVDMSPRWPRRPWSARKQRPTPGLESPLRPQSATSRRRVPEHAASGEDALQSQAAPEDGIPMDTEASDDSQSDSEGSVSGSSSVGSDRDQYDSSIALPPGDASRLYALRPPSGRDSPSLMTTLPGDFTWTLKGHNGVPVSKVTLQFQHPDVLLASVPTSPAASPRLHSTSGSYRSMQVNTRNSPRTSSSASSVAPPRSQPTAPVDAYSSSIAVDVPLEDDMMSSRASMLEPAAEQAVEAEMDHSEAQTEQHQPTLEPPPTSPTPDVYSSLVDDPLRGPLVQPSRAEHPTQRRYMKLSMSAQGRDNYREIFEALGLSIKATGPTSPTGSPRSPRRAIPKTVHKTEAEHDEHDAMQDGAAALSTATSPKTSVYKVEAWGPVFVTRPPQVSSRLAIGNGHNVLSPRHAENGGGVQSPSTSPRGKSPRQLEGSAADPIVPPATPKPPLDSDGMPSSDHQEPTENVAPIDHSAQPSETPTPLPVSRSRSVYAARSPRTGLPLRSLSVTPGLGVDFSQPESTRSPSPEPAGEADEGPAVAASSFPTSVAIQPSPALGQQADGRRSDGRAVSRVTPWSVLADADSILPIDSPLQHGRYSSRRRHRRHRDNDLARWDAAEHNSSSATDLAAVVGQPSDVSQHQPQSQQPEQPSAAANGAASSRRRAKQREQMPVSRPVPAHALHEEAGLPDHPSPIDLSWISNLCTDVQLDEYQLSNNADLAPLNNHPTVMSWTAPEPIELSVRGLGPNHAKGNAIAANQHQLSPGGLALGQDETDQLITAVGNAYRLLTPELSCPAHLRPASRSHAHPNPASFGPTIGTAQLWNAVFNKSTAASRPESHQQFAGATGATPQPSPRFPTRPVSTASPRVKSQMRKHRPQSNMPPPQVTAPATSVVPLLASPMRPAPVVIPSVPVMDEHTERALRVPVTQNFAFQAPEPQAGDRLLHIAPLQPVPLTDRMKVKPALAVRTVEPEVATVSKYSKHSPSPKARAGSVRPHTVVVDAPFFVRGQGQTQN